MKQGLPFLPSVSFTGCVYVLPRKLLQQGAKRLCRHPDSGIAFSSNMSALSSTEGPWCSSLGTRITRFQEAVAACFADSFWQ